MKRILNYEENPETFGESVDRIAKGIDSSQNDTFSIVFKNTQYLNSGMVEKFIDYPGVMFVIKGTGKSPYPRSAAQSNLGI